MLIEADFYWKFIQDKIIRGNGPTAGESKIGYLLSGPLSPSNSNADVDVLHAAVMQYDDTKFWNIERMGTSVTTQSMETSADQIGTFIDSLVHRDCRPA